MSVRNATTSISKRHFAETYGVSESQLERLFQQGMPHEKQSSRKIAIPMPAGRVWYHDYLVDKGRRQAAPKDLDEAKQRKMAAEAELAELELSEKRGELMTVSDFAKITGEAFSRARARLQNLAPRVAAAAFGAPTIPEAQARIEPLVIEVLDELRRADDVPASADSEDVPDDGE
jgi:hypothetical protein